MDNRHVIASSLLDNELAKAFSELVAERWDNWDLSPFMVYLVDTCDPSALPFLAEQFDINGLRGFEMANTEQQQRDLIKRSIALHKFIGTTWAIREACRSVGFPVVLLEEGASVLKPRRGAFDYAYARAYQSMKTGEPSPDDWACFRVLVEADMTRHITTGEARKIRLFVEAYKNERSQLVELGFFQSLVEQVFRPETSNRDMLTLYPLHVFPNPVILSPSGREKTVTVDVDITFIIDDIIQWDDGTVDCITIQKISANQLRVTSDLNIINDRTKTIPIQSVDGLLLGHLTIQQDIKWKNGFNNAYSQAYNQMDTS